MGEGKGQLLRLAQRGLHWPRGERAQAMMRRVQARKQGRETVDGGSGRTGD